MSSAPKPRHPSVNRPSSRNGKPPSNNSRPSSKGASNNTEKRQIVGQYMIGKTIGEGTFGKVKLAIHIPTGEKVAVKILEKNRIKEQADVRRVNREIKILKKARHGNIIQLYEVLDTQNTIYLIMECAEGGEMFDFIVAQKHVAEVQACKFFHQIIDGVEQLHLNEITHRDLKPENLLLKASPDGWLVKIVDFGLSNTHEGGKLLTTACGSPCYAAPEMIAGKKYYGPLADLWSIGVILFALVCGFLPFEDPNTSLLYKKILSGDYKPPKWISSDVQDLIARILEVDPRKRYTIADIRKHPWYNLVSESAVPHETVNVYENQATRAETLAALTEAGLDTQAVMDGVASKACNSLTAMYYLLEQKHRTIRARQLAEQQHQRSNGRITISNSSGSHQTQKTVGSNGNPETTATNNTVNLQPQPQTQSQPQSQPHSTATSNNVAVLHPIQTAAAPSPKSVVGKSPAVGHSGAAGIAHAYLQTPTIMQHHFNGKPNQPNLLAQQQQQAQPQLVPIVPAGRDPSTMPSLDAYLKASATSGPGGASSNNSSVAAGGAGSSRNSLLVPKLKIPQQNQQQKSVGAAPEEGSHRVHFRNVPSVPSSALAGPNPATLTSQTARAPPVTVPVNASSHHPNTARSALPSVDSGSAPLRVISALHNEFIESDVPVAVSYELLSMMPESVMASGMTLGGEETGERPNTRRSHMRSRGGDSSSAPPLSEAMGSLNLEDHLTIATPHRPAPSVPLSGAEARLHDIQTGGFTSGAFVDADGKGTNLKPALAPALNAQAPELPPRASSAGLNGGRRGKNLIPAPAAGAASSSVRPASRGAIATTNTSQTPVGIIRPAPPTTGKQVSIAGEVSQQTTTVVPKSNQFMVSNPRLQAVKNKAAAQGTAIM